ncbi:unnamed protein product [marine sediment metagenome]|uniref:Uncharacterized protein n=1 Tax=marine sediment metagenome TaxID=412755 RepID=X1TPU1_9ZZZZ
MIPSSWACTQKGIKNCINTQKLELKTLRTSLEGLSTDVGPPH